MFLCHSCLFSTPVSEDLFSGVFLKKFVKELYTQLSTMHAYRQYQFSENHISPTDENAFPPYFQCLKWDTRDISYRKSSHNIVQQL